MEASLHICINRKKKNILLYLYFSFLRKEIPYPALAACFGCEDGYNRLPRRVLDALTVLSSKNSDYRDRIVSVRDTWNRFIQDARPKWLTLRLPRFLHPVNYE